MHVVYDSIIVIIRQADIGIIYIIYIYTYWLNNPANAMYRTALMRAAPPDHRHTSTVDHPRLHTGVAIADLHCTYTYNDPNTETRGHDHRWCHEATCAHRIAASL